MVQHALCLFTGEETEPYTVLVMQQIDIFIEVGKLNKVK